MHRRHAASVTHSLKAQKHIEEIENIHRFAGVRFGMSKREINLQASYLAEVSAQLLGTATNAAPPTTVAKSIVRSKAKA